ncbi:MULTISPECIES: DoxX family protein [unclassified Corynebacterium]|uniref:DoxX family protein n=1 Tax=unclassified Corynebacterium TaxID=2624378 RepID=UPI0029CA6C67|nr:MULTISPECIES: DoxX family protein [unclassified Corynebacterium]WPF66174.1 DoxX family protein [Corynebacterium sp. 22KM0430]WPF68666.1 DoxX family protein [Corynebacterium sp. 21KM1197]
MTTISIVLTYVLAAVLAGDALLSIKPPAFISRCLSGVNFPRDWWWALIGIKTLAALALVVGALRQDPSIAATASLGVVGYFLFAIVAHIRAKFLGSEFWLNCLGMTALSAVVAAVNVSQVLS